MTWMTSFRLWVSNEDFATPGHTHTQGDESLQIRVRRNGALHFFVLSAETNAIQMTHFQK